MLPQISSRLNLITLLIAAVTAAVVLRLFSLQIVQYSAYRKLAERQQSFNRVLESARGDIFFKTKKGELIHAATTRAGARLYLNMNLLADAENVYSKLNQVTPVSRDVFDFIIQKKNDPYEVLKRRLTQEEAEKILALNLSGVGLEEEKWRVYPSGRLASHLLGFISHPAGADIPVGQYGIEKYYDDALRGTKGSIFGDKDGRGTLIALWEHFKVDAEEGENIVLTIEPFLQNAVEAEVKNLREKWNAASAGILILDPKTGAIYAMSAEPNFDPNEYQKEKDLSVFLNPFTEKIFELGSVFKPLTMAAAIDQGVLTSQTTYIDRGEVKIGGRVIKNFDGKSHGARTMTQVLEESLNTGAVFAMQQLGGEKLKEYFHGFGLGEKLGIDLPGEVAGDLRNLDTGREIEFATASFGQGVAVTPLELAMALSTLANGGKLMRPFVRDGTRPHVIRQVIKPETAEAVTKMLVDVVDMSLAGGKAKFPNMTIAAKTGTAQIPISRLGRSEAAGYSDEFLHSFFGYFPAYEPRFFVLILLEQPRGVKYASQSITDTFRSIVEFLVNYYTIPPDR